jgi:opacity protein-like surface antigen
VVVLVCGLSSLSFAQGQHLGNLGITAQANLSGTPMLGVDYALTNEASIRFSLGYYKFEEGLGSICGPSGVCLPVYTSAPVHEYSGSVAGLYHFARDNMFSPYAGGEIQYLHARSPARRNNPAEPSTGHRVSMSGIFGLSVRPVSWLSLFGEVGIGHVRGLSVRTFRADLDSSVKRSGITHISPGLRVSF